MDKDERLRAKSRRRNLAWVLGPRAPAPLSDTALVLLQLSLAHAQPTVLLVQERLIVSSSLGVESTPRSIKWCPFPALFAGPALPRQSMVGKRVQVAVHSLASTKSLQFV